MPVEMTSKSGARRRAPLISPIGSPFGHSPILVYWIISTFQPRPTARKATPKAADVLPLPSP